MDVSDKAYDIYDTKLFDLFIVWQKNDKVFKLPVQDRHDIDFALDSRKYICIEVGNACQHNEDRWADADKITYNGYVYVRYSDIKL